MRPPQDRYRSGPSRAAAVGKLDQRFRLALLLVFGVTAWEHVVHTFVLGEQATLVEHLTHLLRDGLMALPLGLLAVWLGTTMAARSARGHRAGGAPLPMAAITSLAYGILLIPSVGIHQLLGHGPAGAAGAQAAHHAVDRLEASRTLAGMALHGLRDAAIAQVVALPLLLGGLALLAGGASRRRGRRPARLRLALGTAAVTALALVASPYSAAPAAAQSAAPAPCSFTRTYNVSAINLKITVNRYGDNEPDGFMYVLDANLGAVRAQEASNTVSPGLRKDPIQPLMLRANLGECVRINFTNRMTQPPRGGAAARTTQQGGVMAAGISPQGVAYDINSQGDAFGNNASSLAPPPGSQNPDSSSCTCKKTYNFYLDPQLGEGGKVFRSGGDSRQLTLHGLFGAILAQPAGSRWLDPETGQDKTNDPNWANWEAIIRPPSGPSFREFGIMYHEFGDEFENLRDAAGGGVPMVEQIAFSYRPASRLLNYRSEPFLRRLNEALTTDKAGGYNSYTFGDPATPIPRSYLGEPTKTRLMHPGAEMLHVHHLHGGGDRWRANPGADDTDIDGGLKKNPIQSARSIRLDSQTIGPNESYNLEHECGAGGCQQAAGDFLMHCHIAHHYIAGMWTFWRVFDARHPGTAGGLNGDTPLAVLPDRNVPRTAVNSGALVGTTVRLPEGSRQVVLNVTSPSTQIALSTLVERQLPPKGTVLDRQDATVWNWEVDPANPSRPVYRGEPEVSTPMVNYTSPTPGARPEILFHPDTGRYVWPLLRPHLGQRPPFAPNGHTGTPWLGPTVTSSRPDGLCPSGAPSKRYHITAVNTPLQMTDGADPEVDPDGEVFVLSKNRSSVTPTTAKPLAIRSNVGDCVDITLTNEIDYINVPAAQNAIDRNHKVNMHTHFVQFDPQGSDGVDTGFSFEQTIRFAGAELPSGTTGDPDVDLTLRRSLTAAAPAGATTIQVNSSARLRAGIWIAVGQGLDTIEVRRITALTPTSVTLDQALSRNHAAGESAGVEFAQYRWFSDVDSGTVFWHDHVDGVHSWAHGLFGAHIIEPRGSAYLDPATGQQVESGDNVVIRPGFNSASVGVDLPAGRSFREFVIWLHNGRVTPQSRGALNRNFGQECEQGTVNLHSEPFGTRVPAAMQVIEPNGGANVQCNDIIDTVDPHVYSSVKYGDPYTPLYRAYVGDPVMIRTLGLVERTEALKLDGHRFRRERFNGQGELLDAATTGISERFDYVLEGGAGGPRGRPGDYRYYTTRNFAKADGGWGIFRVHDRLQSNLRPLPDRSSPPSGGGFPQQTFTGGNPARASGADTSSCPSSAPTRTYNVSIFNQPLPVMQTINGDRPLDAAGNTLMHDRVDLQADPDGIMYALTADVAAIKAGTKPMEPLAIRARVGDCVRINLKNEIAAGTRVGGASASVDMSKLLHDPQLSGGSAVGFNPDSTVPAGSTSTYTYYADKELGTSIFTNGGSQVSQAHGAYGMLVVEPAGASWFDTHTGAPLTSGAGTQVIIRSPSGNFREFVSMPASTDTQMDRSIVGSAGTTVGGRDAYEDDIIGFSYLNYHNEPTAPRLDPALTPFSNPTAPPLDPTGNPDHSIAFSSAAHGDPATELIYRTYAGDPVRWRVGVGGSQQYHVFTVEGHSFPWEPFMSGSHILTGRSIVTGQVQEARLVRGAGGALRAAGDYMVQDGRQTFSRSGIWGIFRVHPPFGSGSSTRALPDLAPVDG